VAVFINNDLVVVTGRVPFVGEVEVPDNKADI
jgi:hypothetical protein